MVSLPAPLLQNAAQSDETLGLRLRQEIRFLEARPRVTEFSGGVDSFFLMLARKKIFENVENTIRAEKVLKQAIAIIQNPNFRMLAMPGVSHHHFHRNYFVSKKFCRAEM